MKKPIKGVGRVRTFVVGFAMFAIALMAGATDAAPDQWGKPAAALAEQIAGILGPGQAHLTIRNQSKISADEIPAIRRSLEEALKTHGVQPSGAESANTIRITLSENLRELLWVAEVAEGSEIRVAMVEVDYEVAEAKPIQERIVLHKEQYIASSGLSRWPDPSDEPVLGMIVTKTGLAVLKKDRITPIEMTLAGWMAKSGVALKQRQQSARDPRGVMISSEDGSGFTAFVPGSECTGSFALLDNSSSSNADGWSVNCHASDDPWPIPNVDSTHGSMQVKAFYSAARNYFTGVVAPSVGVDLPPFYSAALIPRSDGAGLLINGVDGKVLLVEAGALKPVAGTRDWGSDFAALRSGCGDGTQIIVSGSGEALTDSLRAYEIPAQEAVPASTPLAMDGTVTALWTVQDGKSVFAAVRKPASQGQEDTYEVDHVTASCN